MATVAELKPIDLHRGVIQAEAEQAFKAAVRLRDVVDVEEEDLWVPVEVELVDLSLLLVDWSGRESG